METLFKESDNVVKQYADNAYKTAGLSANAYMETVTSFSASLLQSLNGDTKAAADAADMAITDMADNANKMGSSMESIQNAYQGFAKQNYTMLDNLKLGYGGTKTEMERLLADAEKLSGVKYDISNLNDVYSAIHVVQTELGITGTTAKEASSTISGSFGMVSASWSNLVTGIADDSQDFDKLVDDFVDSVATAAENLLPRIETTIGGIGELVEELFPIIVAQIPVIINDILPGLIQSGISMVDSLLTGVQQNLPQITEGALQIFEQLTIAILSMLPQLLEIGLQIILQLSAGIAESLPELVPVIVDILLQIIETLINNLDLLVDAAIELILALAEGLIQALPLLLLRVPEIVIKLVKSLIDNAIKLDEAARELILKLAAGLMNNLSSLLSKPKEILNRLYNEFIKNLSNFSQIGKNIIDGIWSGLSAGWDWLVGKVKSLANSLFGAAKDELDINSPSKKFEWLAEMCVAGWDKGKKGLFSTDDLSADVNASFGTVLANTGGGSGYVGRGIIQYIYVNKEVSTADEMARAIRMESRYGLIRGTSLG